MRTIGVFGFRQGAPPDDPERRPTMALRGKIARFVSAGTLLLAGAAASASAAPGRSASASPGFLTGPSAKKPVAIVVGYVKQHLADYGLRPGDVDDVVATRVVTASDSGATYVYLQQRRNGIDVDGAIADAGVMPDGRLLTLDSRFVGGLREKVRTKRPAISRESATGTAAFHVVRKLGGTAQAAELSTGGISLNAIPVRLVYQPARGGVRLAWDVGIQERDARHWWSARVDAATGALLSKSDYVDDGVADGSSYAVFAAPDDSPNSGSRTVVRGPAFHKASPFGWHDTDGVAGPEFTIPEGNNVHAYID